MREYQVARRGIEAIGVGKILAHRVIRKMPSAAQDALLHHPRIRTDFQHLEIVIRFQDQALGAAQMHFHQFRHVAKVRHQRHFRPVGPKRETNRVGRIVRDGKSVHLDVAHRKRLPRMNHLHAAQPLLESLGKDVLHGVHGRLRDVQRRLPQAQHLRQSVAMIGVFVGD